MSEKQFRFVSIKNIDKAVVQVILFENGEECGTLIFTPDGWEEFKEQVLRTKVRCE